MEGEKKKEYWEKDYFCLLTLREKKRAGGDLHRQSMYMTATCPLIYVMYSCMNKPTIQQVLYLEDQVKVCQCKGGKSVGDNVRLLKFGADNGFVEFGISHSCRCFIG